jgi:hypothetical protein
VPANDRTSHIQCASKDPSLYGKRNHPTQQIAISGIRFGRADAIQQAQEAFVQWNDFFKEFFPKCTILETLRIHSRTTGDGGDIPFGKDKVELTSLCRQFKIRPLDIDASALTQPDTNARNDIPYMINHEEP